MRRLFSRLIWETEAATATEYAVMLGIIIMALFATVVAFGQLHATTWSNMSTDMQTHGLGS